MNNVLVTGATSFLGYHVVKKLNERGMQPRALGPKDQGSAGVLGKLNVDMIEGDVDDVSSLTAAFDGVDTVLHLAFLVTLGGGMQERMHQTNVVGTRHVLQAAADAKVARVVVTSSALAVGVNREPKAMDESADWNIHRVNLPYAETRRQAEQEALATTSPGLSVVVVSPSLTMGPEDFVGAPANKLLKAISAGRLPISAHGGLGCLDVRDFADGMLRAADHGRPGQRYLLSAHNVTIDDFLAEAARISGTKPPRWRLPRWAAYALVAAVEGWCALRRKPPPITRSVLQLMGRYAWYDSQRARTELGWEPRPLADTLTDTIAWLRQSSSA